MSSSASGIMSFIRNMATAGLFDSEPEEMDVEEEPIDERMEHVRASCPESRARFLASFGFIPDPAPAVGDIVALSSVPPIPADNPGPRLLETGDPIINIVERTVEHTAEHTVEHTTERTVSHIVSSVPPNSAAVPGDAVDAGAARAPRLTPKQKAAQGARKIGIFTRHQIACPQQPSGIMEVWLPQHGPHGEDFKRDLSNTLTLFREGGLKQEEWFRFLKNRIRCKGWKLLDHENMPGPGFIRMLPAEWGKIDWPLKPAIQRRLRMRGELVRRTSTRRPHS